MTIMTAIEKKLAAEADAAATIELRQYRRMAKYYGQMASGGSAHRLLAESVALRGEWLAGITNVDVSQRLEANRWMRGLLAETTAF